jgi:rhodanese-related sulfurtransferase
MVAVDGARKVQHVRRPPDVGAAKFVNRGVDAQIGSRMDDMGDPPDQVGIVRLVKTQVVEGDVSRHHLDPPTDRGGEFLPIPPGPGRNASGRLVVRGPDQGDDDKVLPCQQAARDLAPQKSRRAGLAKTIPEMLAKQKGVTRIVLVSPDGEIAALAAAEAADAAGSLPVVVLAGGMKAWRDAKLPIEAGHTRMADPPTDVWYRPYDFKDNVEAAMRQYLEWEVDLVPQVARDGDASFNVMKT